MRKPSKAIAVKINWEQYKKLKDEALQKGTPISKLLSDILAQKYGAESEEASQGFPCDECNFVAKSKAGLGKHKSAKH